jgi:hypothetical protein
VGAVAVADGDSRVARPTGDPTVPRVILARTVSHAACASASGPFAPPSNFFLREQRLVGVARGVMGGPQLVSCERLACAPVDVGGPHR